MKLIESGQEIHFIDVDSDRVPCSLLVKLTDRTYRMTFAYNEAADFFTVSLELSNSGGNTPLVYGEVLRYGKPLFEAGIDVDDALGRFLQNEALMMKFLGRFPADTGFSRL